MPALKSMKVAKRQARSRKLGALSERCQRRFVKALLRTVADRLATSKERISRTN